MLYTAAMSKLLWCEEEGGHGSQPRAQCDASISAGRIIDKLLRTEERYLPSPLYVSMVKNKPQQREELTKWTLEVCCEYECEESVFPLAVSLLDRYLSATLALPASPLCLSATCVLIASKLMESETVTASSLCAAASYNFMPSSLREMERVVLSMLQWDVAAITPQDFIPHLLPIQYEGKNRSNDEKRLTTTLRRHSDTLVAMCVCDCRFLGTPPSLVAAAALNSALRGLGHRGASLQNMTATLAHLCRMESALLQHYTQMIENALAERLRIGQRQRERIHKEDVQEVERSTTPTDLREINF